MHTLLLTVLAASAAVMAEEVVVDLDMDANVHAELNTATRDAPKVVENLKDLAANAPRQTYAKRLLEGNNWGKTTCGVGTKPRVTSECCGGEFDNKIIYGGLAKEGSNVTYGQTSACPVNVASFMSFPNPMKLDNVDAGTRYDIQKNSREAIITTLSSIGSPSIIMAYQKNVKNLDTNVDTYPKGSGWWQKILTQTGAVTSNYKKLRMSFGEKENFDAKTPSLSSDLYWMITQIEEIIEFQGDPEGNGQFSELSRKTMCDQLKEGEKDKQCVHQIIRLGIQNWSPGDMDSSNMTSMKLAYTISTASPVNPTFREGTQTYAPGVLGRGTVSLTMEGVGSCDPRKPGEDSQCARANLGSLNEEDGTAQGLYLTPNSTRLTLRIKDFQYKGTRSMLAIKMFFGTDANTDRQVLFANRQQILFTKQGAGQRMGYFQWSESAALRSSIEHGGSKKYLSRVKPSCYVYETRVGNGKANHRSQCGRLSKVASLRNIGFGVGKAQVRLFPPGATTFAYFTMGSKIASVGPVVNPTDIEWNMAIGIGDMPEDPEMKNLLAYILAAIIVMGFMGCLGKRKWEDHQMKLASSNYTEEQFDVTNLGRLSTAGALMDNFREFLGSHTSSATEDAEGKSEKVPLITVGERDETAEKGGKGVEESP